MNTSHCHIDHKTGEPWALAHTHRKTTPPNIERGAPTATGLARPADTPVRPPLPARAGRRPR